MSRDALYRKVEGKIYNLLQATGFMKGEGADQNLGR